MKIEVGKRYWSREGCISCPVERVVDPVNAFVFKMGRRTFTESGTFLEHGPHGYDLIAEYTGPELVPPGEKVKRTIVLKEVLVRYDEYWMHGWEAGGKFPSDKLVPPDEVVYTGLERVVEV
jgi:hypothetical protein